MIGSELPRFYSWTVVTPEASSLGLGALGVSDDRNRALTNLSDALRDAPAGARGLVHKVMLSFTRPGYLYEALVARGRFDPGSGTVLWETLPGPGTWGPHVTDAPQAIADALPPEAVSAGLADLEAESQRPRAAAPPDATEKADL